jgi:hypothetical protein
MSVGTGTAIALGLGAASAGSSLIGAKMASSASKDAAKTQTAAANQALEYEKQRAADLQGRLQPYQTMGQAAMPGLLQAAGITPSAPAGGGWAGALGVPPGGGPMVGGPSASLVPGSVTAGAQPGQWNGGPGGLVSVPAGGSLSGSTGAGMAPPRPVGSGQTFGAAALGAPGAAGGGLGLPGPGGLAPGGGGGLVRLRAPDGTVKQVPAAQAAFYRARGAQDV